MLIKSKFDDFVRLSRGFDLPDNDIVPGDYPVVASTDIKAYHKEYKVEPPVVITGRSGSLGKVQYITEKCWPLNTALYSKDLRGNNAQYIYYYLQTMHLEQYNAGAGVPTLNQNHLQRLKIWVHPKQEQQKLVSILSAYDNLIEVNNKRIKVLEQIAENLYKEWFVRFRFPGHEKADFENGIPKGWRRGRISEFYTTSSGGTPSREHDEYYDAGTIPWIKTGELQDCLLIDTEEKITESAVKKSSAKFFPKDSVLMAMYGVNIGMLAYSTMDATCNQACCVFRDKGSINTKHYLFQCLKSIRDYLLLISFGAAQQNLSQDLIKRVRIVMPDKETVIRFEQKIEPLYNETEHLLKENACLIRQRDLLLPRLMSGKMEV